MASPLRASARFLSSTAINSLWNENQDLRNRNADLQRQIESLNDDFVRLTKNYEAAARTVRRVREAACDVSGGIE